MDNREKLAKLRKGVSSEVGKEDGERLEKMHDEVEGLSKENVIAYKKYLSEAGVDIPYCVLRRLDKYLPENIDLLSYPIYDKGNSFNQEMLRTARAVNENCSKEAYRFLSEAYYIQNPKLYNMINFFNSLNEGLLVEVEELVERIKIGKEDLTEQDISVISDALNKAVLKLGFDEEYYEIFDIDSDISVIPFLKCISELASLAGYLKEAKAVYDISLRLENESQSKDNHFLDAISRIGQRTNAAYDDVSTEHKDE